MSPTAAGGIDTAALAALLSQQIKSEMEALRGGIEQRLSNIEQRVMAHEQMVSLRRAGAIIYATGAVRAGALTCGRDAMSMHNSSKLAIPLDGSRQTQEYRARALFAKQTSLHRWFRY